MRTAIVDADTILYAICFQLEQETDFSKHMDALDSWFNDLFDKTSATHYHAFLTVTKANRYKKAVTREYKGNRKNRKKPRFFVDLRNYMIEKYKAEHYDGWEADDLVLTMGKHYDDLNEDWVIVTVDKDLHQMPGYFYDPKNDKFFHVVKSEAAENLALQWLAGDSTDNVVGIPGIGPKKAAKILEGELREDYPEVILKAYRNKFGTVEGVRRFAETAELIIMDLEMDKFDDYENCPQKIRVLDVVESREGEKHRKEQEEKQGYNITTDF